MVPASRSVVRGLAAAVALVLLGGCGPAPSGSPPAGSDRDTPDRPSSPASGASSSAPGASSSAVPGTVPPAWLGTRVLPRTETGFGQIRPSPPQLRTRRFTLPDTVASLPGSGYASRVVSPAPRRVIARSTWEPGCPVGRDRLAWVRVAFVGFDGARHTGELLVHDRVAEEVVTAFERLYRIRFPIEEMRITTAAELDAPPTGDGNNTSAFVCRAVRGETTYSQHAYGLAIDVNPFQNPYLKGTGADRIVLPELASAYADRDRDAPGMLHPGGPAVAAFTSLGWGWGGSWDSLRDLQHFSENGR